MKKKFVANLLFLVAINLLIKPFWFLGIEVGVQNRVSNADYGLFFTLFNFSMLFNIILDFGITNFNNREIAKHRQLVTKYFSNIFLIKLALGLFYLVIGILVAYFTGYRQYSMILFGLLAFNQFLASMVLYLRSYINGMLMFVTDSVISVLDRTIMIALCSVLLWTNIAGGRFMIHWFALIQTFAYAITVVTAFIIVVNNCDTFKFRADIRYFYFILRKSLPFSLLVVLMQLYTRIDAILIERLLPNGAEQAGIYAYSFRILDVFTNFAYLFPVLLLPMFAKMLKQRDDILPLLRLSSILIWVASITIAIACFRYSDPIIYLLYENTKGSPILGILIFSYIGISTTYIFGTLLTANGNLRQLNIMSAIGVVINIGLNLLLIPKMQAKGAAIACVVTQAFTAIVQVMLVSRHLKVAIPVWDYIKVLVLIVLLLTVSHFSMYIHNWIIGFGVVLITGVVGIFGLRLVAIKEVIKLVVGSGRN